mmetsp:Transcript_21064/g.58327  ORF Transcript_21064/g.58327 Transcript_21064/m.58327 type:complete len:114 (+) Transcript_21064:417-758(+)
MSPTSSPTQSPTSSPGSPVVPDDFTFGGSGVGSTDGATGGGSFGTIDDETATDSSGDSAGEGTATADLTDGSTNEISDALEGNGRQPPQSLAVHRRLGSFMSALGCIFLLLAL